MPPLPDIVLPNGSTKPPAIAHPLPKLYVNISHMILINYSIDHFRYKHFLVNDKFSELNCIMYTPDEIFPASQTILYLPGFLNPEYNRSTKRPRKS